MNHLSGDGLKSGQVALYTKVHHAGIDGQAGVALGKAMIGRVRAAIPTDFPMPAAPWLMSGFRRQVGPRPLPQLPPPQLPQLRQPPAMPGRPPAAP